MAASRFRVAAVIATFVSVAPIADPTAEAQTRAWQSATDGLWLDASRWNPADAPNSTGETAAFDVTGSYTVRLAPTATTSVGAIVATAGEIALATSDLADARLVVAGDTTVANARVELTQVGLPNDVDMAIEGELGLSDGGYLGVRDGASLTASTTVIGAGAALAPTTVELTEGAVGSLGDTRIAESGGGSFEGSLTVINDAVARLDNLSLATTGVADRLGVVQVFNASLVQTGVAEIGAATGDGRGLLVASDSSHVTLDDARVRATGELKNQRGHLHLESALLVDGGDYEEAAGGTRSLGDNAVIEVRANGQALFNETPLQLGAEQSLLLEDAFVASLGGVELAGGSLSVTGDSQIDGSLVIGPDGAIAVTAGAELTVSGRLTLDGSLTIAPTDALTPELGDVFRLASADSVVGGFTSASAPALPTGLAWRLEKDAESISLAVITAGDFNADGAVDACDYVVWRETVGESGPLLAADGDGSGAIDENDYLVWMNAYATANATSTAPEPNTTTLAFVCLTVAAARRRADVSKPAPPNCGR